MGTLIYVVVGVVLILVAVELLSRGARDGVRGYAVVVRGIMEAFGVRPEAAQTRRERIGMLVLTVLIMAGVASALGLLVRWLIT